MAHPDAATEMRWRTTFDYLAKSPQWTALVVGSALGIALGIVYRGLPWVLAIQGRATSAPSEPLLPTLVRKALEFLANCL
jgi:hypothetical protein